jgi:uncharacterized membrane protein
MTPSDTHRFPDDLQDVASLLRDNRPEATALELDGVKQQVRFRASRAASGHAQKGSTMKSRLAMMAMLVSGLLMSGTGATLAVTDTSDNAAKSQYPPVVQVQETPAAGNVLPEQSSGGDETPAAQPDAKPERAETAPATREQGAQPAAQVAAASGGGEQNLPFTGFAAIPILIGGIALMGGGLAMRRRTAA